MAIPTQPNRPRRHLPQLNPSQLQLANERIDQLHIGSAAKAQLKAMLGAAANPDSERPDVVLKTLDHARQQNAAQLQQHIGTTLTSVTQSGGQALLSMDEAEWQRLQDASKSE